jgi:Raf kinase inhibitor-like YbhB/YbcL family protein
MFSLIRVICAAFCVAAPFAARAATPALAVQIGDVSASGYLPLSAAFCMPPAYGATPRDRNPGVTWSAGPQGTLSYALIMSDPDVPRALSLINKPGVIIPADAPRFTIYHWVLIDIPPSVTAIAAGADSDRFVPGGKPAEPSPVGRRGTNDYVHAFAKDPAMNGPYAGYDGPCPPLNDQRIHDYRIQVFALNLAHLPLQTPFFGPAAIAAMQGHVLASGVARAKFAFGVSR